MKCFNCAYHDKGAGFEITCEWGVPTGEIQLQCPHYIPIDVKESENGRIYQQSRCNKVNQ